MKKADKFDPAKWLVENKITFQSKLNEIEYMPDTDYEDYEIDPKNQPDDEEFDFYSATIKDLPFPDTKGNDRMIPTLVVDETGDEFQEFHILNTPEDEEQFKNAKERGREIEGVFKVKMDNGEIKTAVVYPPTSSKSEFYGKFNEGDLKKYKGLKAALTLINENEEIHGLQMTNDGIRNILPGTYFPKENKIIIRTNTQNPKGYKTKSLITITTNQGEYNVQYIPDTDSFNDFNVFNLKSFKDLEILLNKIKNADPSVVKLMEEEKMSENEEVKYITIKATELGIINLRKYDGFKANKYEKTFSSQESIPTPFFSQDTSGKFFALEFDFNRNELKMYAEPIFKANLVPLALFKFKSLEPGEVDNRGWFEIVK
jgi:hypothetical protein